MKSHYLLGTLLFIVITSGNIIGQNACGYDYDAILSEQYKLHPEWKHQTEQLENFILNNNLSGNRVECDIIKIPIVIHAIYAEGSTSTQLSTLAAESIVEDINEYFRKQLTYTSIPNIFQERIADVEIEFELAKKNPFGQPATGVTHTYDNNAYNGSGMSSAINWNTGTPRYLQIWRVGSTMTGFPPAYAGLNFGGVIAGRTYFAPNILAHEIGHYLSLHHTWGQNNNAGGATNCNSDDYIEDTPNTRGGNSCNVARNTCDDGPGDEPDNVHNIMDYTGACRLMFTTGQKERMRTALQSGQYSTLTTSQNHALTGINTSPRFPCGVTSPPPTAGFTFDKSMGCEGLTVQFTDTSLNTTNGTLNWSFPGGNPSVSTKANPLVVYKSSGKYNITLTVTTPGGTDTKTVNGAINIISPLGETAPFQQSFESPTFPLNITDPSLSWFINLTGSETWEPINTVSASGNSSLRVKNESSQVGKSYRVVSPIIDMSSVGKNEFLTFKYAYAQRTITSNDRFMVRISTDCGASWATLFLKEGKKLSTNGEILVPTNFIPQITDWMQDSISLDNYTGKHIQLKFISTPRPNGNFLYLDDINVGNTVFTSTEGLHIKPEQLTVFPNPVNNTTAINVISRNTNSGILSLHDAAGRILGQKIIDGYSIRSTTFLNEISSNLNPGIYFIRYLANGQSTTKRIVVLQDF